MPLYPKSKTDPAKLTLREMFNAALIWAWVLYSCKFQLNENYFLCCFLNYYAIYCYTCHLVA